MSKPLGTASRQAARFARHLKSALKAAAMVLIVLALIVVRVVWSSRAEWRAAGGEDRIVHLGRAARLYAPGNPYSRRALDALADAGRAGSLEAWQEVRSSILATRSFYTPHPELLAEANDAIAQMMAQKDGKMSRAWHAARLAQDEAPSVGWSLVAIFGLFSWIGAAVAFILWAIDADDRLRPRLALLLSLSLLVGLALFFVGLARA
jgi:hypothetical protein